MSYDHGYTVGWTVNTQVATTDGDLTLQAAPGVGSALVVQVLTICITTPAAQAFDVEDDATTPVEVFKAPASLAVGTYGVDFGPRGRALTENAALVFNTAAAGVGATITGFGYTRSL